MATLPHSVTVAAEWKGDSAGGCCNFDSCIRNPQFGLAVTTRTRVRVTLKHEPRGGRLFQVACYIVDKKGERVQNIFQGEEVGTTGTFINKASVMCELDLDPRPYPYTVLPSTFSPGEETTFTVTVESSSPVTMTPLAAYTKQDLGDLMHTLNIAGEWRGPSAGGAVGLPTFGDNPQWLLSVNKRTRIHCVLKQTPVIGTAFVPVNMMLLALDTDGPPRAIVATDMKATSGPHTNRQEISMTVTVDARSRPYTLLPSTYNAGEEATFTIAIMADNPVNVQQAGVAPEPGRSSVPGMPHKQSVKSEWKGVTAGGCFNYSSCTNNPQFIITVSEPTRVVVTLKQFVDVTPPAKLFAISCHLVDKKGGRVATAIYQGEQVANSGQFVAKREVSFECDLQPKPYPYTLLPCTFSPNEEAPFEITLLSNRPVAMTSLASARNPLAGLDNVVAVSGEWKGRTAGGCVEYLTARYNPQFLLRVGSKRTRLAITMEQKPVDGALHSIALIVCNLGGNTVTILTKAQQLATSGPYINLQDVMCEVSLDPSPTPYTLFPTTFNPGCEAVFNLRVHSDAPVTVEAAPLLPDPTEGLGHQVALQGEWKGASAGGCCNYPDTAGNNPQFFVTVTEKCRVLVSLRQAASAKKHHAVGLLIADKRGRKVTTLTRSEQLVTSGSFINYEEVTCATTLEPRPYPYTILPSTFYPGEEGAFTVTVYSEHNRIRVEPATEAAIQTRLAAYRFTSAIEGEWGQLTAGGCHNFPTAVLNPHYKLTITQTANARVVLKQPKPNNSASLLSMGFLIVKNGGEVVREINDEQLVGTSGQYSASQEIESFVTLAASPQPYTIFVSTFTPFQFSKFSLEVHADQRCVLEELSPPVVAPPTPELVAEAAPKLSSSPVKTVAFGGTTVANGAASATKPKRPLRLAPPPKPKRTNRPAPGAGQRSSAVLSSSSNSSDPVEKESKIEDPDDFLEEMFNWTKSLQKEPSLTSSKISRQQSVKQASPAGSAPPTANVGLGGGNPALVLPDDDDEDEVEAPENTRVSEQDDRLKKELDLLKEAMEAEERRITAWAAPAARPRNQTGGPRNVGDKVDIYAERAAVKAREDKAREDKAREDKLKADKIEANRPATPDGRNSGGPNTPNRPPRRNTPGQSTPVAPEPALPTGPPQPREPTPQERAAADALLLKEERDKAERDRLARQAAQAQRDAEKAAADKEAARVEAEKEKERKDAEKAAAAAARNAFKERSAAEKAAADKAAADKAALDASAKERQAASAKAAAVRAEKAAQDRANNTTPETPPGSPGPTKAFAKPAPPVSKKPVASPAGSPAASGSTTPTPGRSLPPKPTPPEKFSAAHAAIERSMKAGPTAQVMESKAAQEASSPPPAATTTTASSPAPSPAGSPAVSSPMAERAKADADATPVASAVPAHLHGGRGRLASRSITKPESAEPQVATVEELQELARAVNVIFSTEARDREAFEEILFADDHGLILHMANVALSDGDDVAVPLIRLFAEQGRANELIDTLVEHEIERTERNAALFRGNSLVTKVLSAYCKLIGNKYLVETLHPALERARENPAKMKVDPRSFAGSPAEFSAALEYVVAVLHVFSDYILASGDRCPTPIRSLCQFMRQEVIAKFGEEAAQTVIGGHIFLRFFCPAIVTPEKFGLCKERPDADVMAAYVVISKALQRLANQTHYLGSEEGGNNRIFTEALNGFIDDVSPRFTAFLNTLSSPSEEEVAQNGMPNIPPMNQDTKEIYVSVLKNVLNQNKAEIVARMTEPFKTATQVKAEPVKQDKAVTFGMRLMRAFRS